MAFIKLIVFWESIDRVFKALNPLVVVVFENIWWLIWFLLVPLGEKMLLLVWPLRADWFL